MLKDFRSLSKKHGGSIVSTKENDGSLTYHYSPPASRKKNPIGPVARKGYALAISNSAKGKRLFYVGGKFSDKQAPVIFPSLESVKSTAAWMIRKFPNLSRYHWLSVPR